MCFLMNVMKKDDEGGEFSVFNDECDEFFEFDGECDEFSGLIMNFNVF